MIPQRLFALQYITSEYTLFCDDDVELSADFIEKLAEPLKVEDMTARQACLNSFHQKERSTYWHLY